MFCSVLTRKAKNNRGLPCAFNFSRFWHWLHVFVVFPCFVPVESFLRLTMVACVLLFFSVSLSFFFSLSLFLSLFCLSVLLSFFLSFFRLLRWSSVCLLWFSTVISHENTLSTSKAGVQSKQQDSEIHISLHFDKLPSD